jgi:hypothetical protein
MHIPFFLTMLLFTPIHNIIYFEPCNQHPTIPGCLMGCNFEILPSFWGLFCPGQSSLLLVCAYKYSEDSYVADVHWGLGLSFSQSDWH